MLTTTIIISCPFRHAIMPIDLLPRFKTRESKHRISGRRIVIVAETHRDETCFLRCRRHQTWLRGRRSRRTDVRQEEYAIYGQDKGEVSNTRVTMNLVILPPDDDTDTVSGPQPFITNLAVSDELRIERQETARKIERYDNCATIENSYSSIKQCGMETSKAFEIRWFNFAFACVIYNHWLLVDFLTQGRIGVIETRTKPRITLKRFLEMLDQVLIPDR